MPIGSSMPPVIVVTPQDLDHALEGFLPEPTAAANTADAQTVELDAFVAETGPLEAFDRKVDVSLAPSTFAAAGATPRRTLVGRTYGWGLILGTAAVGVVIGFFTAVSRGGEVGELVAALADATSVLTTSQRHDPAPPPVVEDGDLRPLLETIGLPAETGSTGETADRPAPPRSVEVRSPRQQTSPVVSTKGASVPLPPSRSDVGTRPIPTATLPPGARPTTGLISERLVAPTDPAVATAGFDLLSPAIPVASALTPPARAANIAPPTTPAVSAESGGPRPESASEINSINSVLAQYRRAFADLDSGVAAAVWPSVDRRALDRAFSQLSEQAFTFTSCDVSVQGILASAACVGQARFVPKVGNRNPRFEPRQWDFRLRRSLDRWVIEAVTAR